MSNFSRVGISMENESFFTHRYKIFFKHQSRKANLTYREKLIKNWKNNDFKAINFARADYNLVQMRWRSIDEKRGYGECIVYV